MLVHTRTIRSRFSQIDIFMYSVHREYPPAHQLCPRPCLATCPASKGQPRQPRESASGGALSARSHIIMIALSSSKPPFNFLIFARGGWRREGGWGGEGSGQEFWHPPKVQKYLKLVVTPPVTLRTVLNLPDTLPFSPRSDAPFPTPFPEREHALPTDGAAHRGAGGGDPRGDQDVRQKRRRKRLFGRRRDRVSGAQLQCIQRRSQRIPQGSLTPYDSYTEGPCLDVLCVVLKASGVRACVLDSRRRV